MPKAFYASLRRAVVGVAERERLRITKKKLRSLGEIELHYPQQTRDATVRNLRQKLLPRLTEFIGSQKRFSSVEIERRLVYERAGRRQQLESKWSSLEHLLYERVRHSPQDGQRRIMLVLMKATDLMGGIYKRHPNSPRWPAGIFEDRIKVEIDESFATLVDEARSDLDPESARLLVAFRDELFPPESVMNADLKSSLYVAVNFGQHQSPGLKPEFVFFLRETESQAMTSLVTAAPEPLAEFVTSPLLDKVLLRDVLAPFQFVEGIREREEPTPIVG